MRSRLFSIFKTLFVVLLVMVTATMILAGCNLFSGKKGTSNKGTTDKGTTDKGTTDSGYTVPKETAEMQAIIDDWIANKAVKIDSFLDGDDSPLDTFILYGNILYRKCTYDIEDSHYQKCLLNGRLIEVKTSNEIEIYQARYNLKTFDMYNWDGSIILATNNYIKIMEFNAGLNDDCYEIKMIDCFKKYFINKGNGVFGIEKNEQTLKELITDFYYIGYGMADIEKVGEAEEAATQFNQRYGGDIQAKSFEELKSFFTEFFGESIINDLSKDEKDLFYKMTVEFKQNEITTNIGRYKTRFSLFDGEINKLQVA